MPEAQDLHKKSDLIRRIFAPLIGQRLTRYEAGEAYFEEEGLWERWDDLPLRLYFSPAFAVSISWSGFDDLRVASDDALPHWYGHWPTIRWRSDCVPELENYLGHNLIEVKLGRGEMTIEGEDIEIWTRLLLGFENGWFEIFNALDENGYNYHSELPEGEYRSCV